MEHLRAGNCLERHIIRTVFELRVAFPDHGTFARAVIDHDKRDLSLRAVDAFCVRKVNTFSLKRSDADITGRIRPKATDIGGAQTKPAEPDHRGRDLAAGGL